MSTFPAVTAVVQDDPIGGYDSTVAIASNGLMAKLRMRDDYLYEKLYGELSTSGVSPLATGVSPDAFEVYGGANAYKINADDTTGTQLGAGLLVRHLKRQSVRASGTHVGGSVPPGGTGTIVLATGPPMPSGVILTTLQIVGVSVPTEFWFTESRSLDSMTSTLTANWTEPLLYSNFSYVFTAHYWEAV